MKHLKHTSEITETFKIYACNMHVILHPDLLLYQIKHLKHTFKTTETLETYACNMKHTLATYT
jgi:hypothetical protein